EEEQARELPLDAAKIKGHGGKQVKTQCNSEGSGYDHDEHRALATSAKKPINDTVNQVYPCQRGNIKAEIHHLDQQEQKTRHIAVRPGEVVGHFCVDRIGCRSSAGVRLRIFAFSHCDSLRGGRLCRLQQSVVRNLIGWSSRFVSCHRRNKTIPSPRQRLNESRRG